MTDLRAIPSGPHFAIITERSVYIPGDERSRTNPGHGYPERTETYIGYQAFTDRAEWEARVDRLSQAGQTFRAMAVTPARIERHISVSVEN